MFRKVKFPSGVFVAAAVVVAKARKCLVLWTTTALDDNFSVVSRDINFVHSSLIPGQFQRILNGKRKTISLTL